MRKREARKHNEKGNGNCRQENYREWVAIEAREMSIFGYGGKYSEMECRKIGTRKEIGESKEQVGQK